MALEYFITANGLEQQLADSPLERITMVFSGNAVKVGSRQIEFRFDSDDAPDAAILLEDSRFAFLLYSESNQAWSVLGRLVADLAESFDEVRVVVE